LIISKKSNFLFSVSKISRIFAPYTMQMKQFIVRTITAIALILAVGMNVLAQGCRLHNASNAQIGKIENDGTVRNASNAQIGKISSDGTVRNASNGQVGKISSDGAVRNASNVQIGKIENDGKVRNANNAQIGKVDSDGTVRNASNAQIGIARGDHINRQWVAAFYFCFFKDEVR
jgi:hypothetical protein